ncbi:hypothetical protein [Halogeometricum borinquense]|nr:hypothetical protein [Halogeometricum borinquense]
MRRDGVIQDILPIQLVGEALVHMIELVAGATVLALFVYGLMLLRE